MYYIKYANRERNGLRLKWQRSFVPHAVNFTSARRRLNKEYALK